MSTTPPSERRYLTIVFVDMVGYTLLSEQLDPEDLRLLQRRYQNLVLSVMERFGGFVAQFTGDGVLVYFGYPLAHENEAERALRASLELLRRLRDLDTSVNDATLPQFAARIGIHTGLVLIGPELSSGGVSEFSAIGEAVNLAARLQAEAPSNAVVISQETARLVEGRFLLRELGPRPIKGISRKIIVHEVIAPLEGSSPSDTWLASRATGLVGRQSFIELILEHWRTVRQQGRCRTVAVIGDAGIGKTRLVREFCTHPALTEAAVVQASCHELFSSTPLYPLASLLWARVGLTPQDALGVRLQKISTFLDEMALNTAENNQLIGSLLGLASSGPVDQIAPTPLLYRRKQFEFIVEVLRRVVHARPTVLWIEDAHWLDASSADLLKDIVASLSRLPLLIILTRRSFPIGNALPEPNEVVRLNQLSKAEALELARSIPGASALSSDALDLAVDAAEGVPLFIEQFVVSLAEEHGSSMPPRMSKVPLRIAEIMSGRLDRRPGARKVVQTAACIGRSFTPAFLSRLLDQDGQSVAESLQGLVEAEILLPRRYGAEIKYEFRHALLQRIAYETMLQSERQAAHLRVVEVIREPDQSQEIFPEVLAHHLTEAGQFPNAVQAWLSAGVQAARRSAHAEAIEHIRKGISILGKVPDPDLRRQLEIKLQAALMGSLVATEGATSMSVSECCERGLELCRQGAPDPMVLPFAFGQFTFTHCRGKAREAEALARLFLSLAQSANNESARVVGHRMLGMVLMGQGKAMEAKEQLEISLKLYSPERDAASTYQFGQSTEVHSKSTFSLVLFCLGEVDRALDVGIDALRLADTLRHPHSTAIPLTYVGGWVFGLCEASDHLLYEANRLIALSEQHQLGAFKAHGMGFRGWALVQKGQLAEGAMALEAAVNALDSIEFRLSLSGYLGALAEALRLMGRLREAQATCERALASMAESNFLWLEPEFRRIEGLVLKDLSPQHPTKAEEAIRRSIACARSLDFPVLERRCLYSLKQALGPDRHDADAEMRLASLAYLGDLAAKVAVAMKAPSRKPDEGYGHRSDDGFRHR